MLSNLKRNTHKSSCRQNAKTPIGTDGRLVFLCVLQKLISEPRIPQLFYQLPEHHYDTQIFY